MQEKRERAGERDREREIENQICHASAVVPNCEPYETTFQTLHKPVIVSNLGLTLYPLGGPRGPRGPIGPYIHDFSGDVASNGGHLM